MDTIIFHVVGMSCGYCTKSIQDRWNNWREFGIQT